MAFPTSAANDVANAVLDWYTRGPAVAQSIQNKPLLRVLNETKKTFPAGKQYVHSNVVGAWMISNTTVGPGTDTFMGGYSESEQLSFFTSDHIQDVKYEWKEVHAGLLITWTELKKSGISINDGGQVARHTASELAVLTDLLEDRYADFLESWQQAKNNMLWKDGSQDSTQVPGVLSILTDDPTAGSTGGLARTNTWWRHRTLVGASKVTASASEQTLTKALRKELVQLRRYGGQPSRALCGSDFLEGLRLEIHEKGYYTQTGFTGTQDIGIGAIRLDNLVFEYDPTLDSLGLSKRCYIVDTRRLRLRPMEGEDDKLSFPERPYDYAIFLKSMFWTGALECTQLNAQGVYEVA